MAQDCCEPVDEIQEAVDDVLDPTMSSCCQRDLEEQRRVAHLIGKLRAADRVDERTRMQSQVLCTAPTDCLDEESDFGSDGGEIFRPILLTNMSHIVTVVKLWYQLCSQAWCFNAHSGIYCCSLLSTDR